MSDSDPVGHPRSGASDRDEIELFLRDAYAAGANAAQRRSLVTAMEYAAREAPKLRAILRSPIPAQPSPEQQRDADELLEDFQRACERCVSHLASDEGYARTDAKNRAILRNELRSRLLSVVSPPADKILGYRVEVDPKMPPNEIRLVGTDGQSITYVLPPADTGKET